MAHGITPAIRAFRREKPRVGRDARALSLGVGKSNYILELGPPTHESEVGISVVSVGPADCCPRLRPFQIEL